MPEISSEDLTIYETFPQSVFRYCSVAPRPVIYRGQVNGTPSIDSKSKGYFQFTYDNASGTMGDCEVGMSIDIGTAPGLRDIVTLRMRKLPTSSIMYIEEVAAGAAPIENNHYFSVVEQYYPHLKLPRLVGRKNNSSYVNSFTEYHDYDIAYTDENDDIQPQANITISNTSRCGVKPADWVDAGQSYRTVTLSGFFSFAIATGATITGYLWDEKDSTITVGSDTSANITLQVPVGHRIISLRVTDSNGTTHTRRQDLWAHDDSYPPLTALKPSSDDRDEGRTMAFDAFGSDGDLSDSSFPKGTVVCYWEDAAFGATGAPSSYIDAFSGWLKEESTTLKLHDRSTVNFKVDGIAAMLSSFIGFAQKINTSATPNRWFKMDRVTIDRVIHYYLREYTTALNLCNFYTSGVTTRVRAEDVKKSNIWSQVSDLAKGYYGTARSDSYNSIWLRRHYSYMELAERSDVETIMSINKSHWLDDDGLEVSYDYQKKVSIVTGSGSFVESNKNRLIYSKAPGLVPAETGNDEEAPFQRTTSQVQLNKLTGHHYARVNNPYGETTLKLKGNWDFFEPAWGEPFSLLWNDPSLRDTEVQSDFLINKVSVSHNNEFGSPAKVVTLTLEKATIGDPGITYTPPGSPAYHPVVSSVNFPKIDIITYTPAEWFSVPASVPTLAAFTNSVSSTERYYVLRDTQDKGIEWEESGTTGSGTGIQFMYDPFSPLYMGTGTEVNGWWLTDTNINRVLDVFNTSGGTGSSVSVHPESFEDFTNSVIKVDNLWASRTTKNFVMGIGYHFNGAPTNDYVPYVFRTIDGVTWNYDNTAFPGFDEDKIGTYRITMSSHIAGLVYLTGRGTFMKSEDYGATWEDIYADHPLLAAQDDPTYGGATFDGILHLPFAANPRSDRFYFAHDGIVGIIGMPPSLALVDPIPSGNRLYYYDMLTKVRSVIPWPGFLSYYEIAWLTSCDTDPTKLAALMWGIADSDDQWDQDDVPHSPYSVSYLSTSENAGKTWNNRHEVGDASRIKIPTKAPKFLYLYGAQPSRLTPPFPDNAGKPYIAVSNNFGKDIVEGSRNLVNFTAARIHHICGAY